MLPSTLTTFDSPDDSRTHCSQTCTVKAQNQERIQLTSTPSPESDDQRFSASPRQASPLPEGESPRKYRATYFPACSKCQQKSMTNLVAGDLQVIVDGKDHVPFRLTSLTTLDNHCPTCQITPILPLTTSRTFAQFNLVVWLTSWSCSECKFRLLAVVCYKQSNLPNGAQS